MSTVGSTAWTERSVQRQIVGFGPRCLWSPQRSLIALNTSALTPWEADILIVQPSGLVYEVEVKVSVSDLRREMADKAVKHRTLAVARAAAVAKRAEYPQMVSRYYIAAPAEMADALDSLAPVHAGLIVVGPLHPRPWVMRQPLPLAAQRADDAARLKVLTSVYYRSWQGVAFGGK